MVKAASLANKVSAPRAFTDREEPRRKFWDAHAYLAANPDEFTVLSFCGIGGIGKTMLVKQLCKELKIRETGSTTSKAYPYASTDLGSLEGVSKVSILRSLASQLYAFDEGRFRFYRVRSALKVYEEKSGIAAVQQDEADRFGGNPWVGTIVDIAAATPLLGSIANIVNALDSARATVMGQKESRNLSHWLNELAIKEQSAIIDEFHEYFRDDLIDAVGKGAVPVAIFIDTYERFGMTLGADASAHMRNEKWLQDIVRYVPGILWVISGRERLGWGDEFGIAEGELVLGNLTQSDSEGFLRNAGLDESLLTPLYELTQGTPIYLDICVDTYERILEQGGTPTIEDFGHDTSRLVERYLRYMDSDEIDLARLLACFRRWNKHQVSWVCEQTPLMGFSDERYERFMRHSFIIEDDNGFSYMHQLVRETVLGTASPEFTHEMYRWIWQVCCDGMKDAGGTKLEGAIDDLLNAFIAWNPTPEEGSESALAQTHDFTTFLIMFFQPDSYFAKIRELHAHLARVDETRGLSDIERGVISSIKAGDYLFAADGEKAVTEARAAMEKLSGARDRFVFAEYRRAAELIMHFNVDQGDEESTLAISRQIYEDALAAYGENDVITIQSAISYASALINAGKGKEAQDIAKEMILLAQSLPEGFEHVKTRALLAFAHAFISIGDYLSATTIAEELYDEICERGGELTAEADSCLSTLALGMENAERYTDAAQVHLQRYEAYAQSFGMGDPNTDFARFAAAIDLGKAEDFEEAAKLGAESLAFRREYYGPEHDQTAEAQRLCDIVREAMEEQAESTE